MSDSPRSLSVSDIKAAFEARSSQSTADEPDNSSSRPRSPNGPLHFPRLHRLYNQQQPANADMSAAKVPLKSKSFPKPSIDSVLDQTAGPAVPANDNQVPRPQTPAGTSTSSRPGASTRPSWIGPKPPERSASPSIAAMKQPVTITYSSSGLQPPVFIFTSLSEPSWEAVEMSAQKSTSGTWTFSKTFEVTEGEYQYKFRLGPGDWWVTDDDQPVVDDGDGNKNNLVVVKPKEGERPKKITLPTPSFNAPQALPSPAPGPLMDHEVFPHRHASNGTGEMPDRDAMRRQEQHESQAQHSPLLKHESLNPTSAEQEHSPLFDHESMTLGVHADDGHDRKSDQDKITNAHACIPAEADASDKSLEPFPTDKQGIYEKIRRASMQNQANDTGHRKDQSNGADSVSPVNSLPSVVEGDEDDEELDKLHEIEEQEAERELEEEGDPLREEKVVADLIQTKGLWGTALDLLKDPWCLGSTIVLALGIVVGWYGLRYA